VFILDILISSPVKRGTPLCLRPHVDQCPVGAWTHVTQITIDWLITSHQKPGHY